MSNSLFVLDANRNILDPCHPAVARKLQTQLKAKMLRRYPGVIVLQRAVEKPNPQSLILKIDPGSKHTGFALVNPKGEVVWGAELTHRGQAIKASLESRRSLRRGRRARHTRYRQPRFLNRCRFKGWLAPSLMHRVLTTETWVKRICRYAHVVEIRMELVSFDSQQIENPEINGVEYQQGELAGYEVRQYLLEKWGRKCSYCGVENVPLQVEHIQPKAKGGTNRISNLCLSCEKCNINKGTQDVKVFLAKKPDVLKRILSQAKRPLKDAAAVNSTRSCLFNQLHRTGLLVTTGSGGLTKFNRTRLNLPKAHWLDAACVGVVDTLKVLVTKPMFIKATGHGNRQMCGTDRFGFPTRHRSIIQVHKGFQTGDIVKAVVTTGKKVGTYVGRVLCRASGSFDIATKAGRVSGVSHKYCSHAHQKDGYNYAH